MSDIYIKLPNAAATWSAIYYRYDFGAESSTLLVIGTHAYWFESSLQQVFSSASEDTRQVDPFGVLAILINELSAIYEEKRNMLDIEVQKEEAKTGLTPRPFNPALKLDNFDDHSTHSLHSVAGLLTFFERAIEFQGECIEFLMQQHCKMTEMRKQGLKQQKDSADLEMAAEKIQRSLDLNLTFSRNRHKQVLTLLSRVMTQVKIVDNLIIRQDARTNIVLAEQSKTIAIATRKDSVAMKTIAALTMFFLPGTFVAVCSSMPKILLLMTDSNMEDALWYGLFRFR